MAQAITASTVRDSLGDVANITIPSTLTDTIIDDSITRWTGWAMVEVNIRNLNQLGTEERDAFDQVVLDLVLASLRKALRPDDEEMHGEMRRAKESAQDDLETLSDVQSDIKTTFEVL